jgi:hypothetical protein
MKRPILVCVLLFLLAISCRGISAEATLEVTPEATTPSLLTESASARLARQEIREVVGGELVHANWVTLKRENLVFLVNYATDLNPDSQPDAFLDQFNRVALIASTYFHRTDTQAVNVMVMAEDVDFPTEDGNPPLRQIVIETAAIADWADGKLTDAEFIESWFVVPLEIFPTPQ